MKYLLEFFEISVEPKDIMTENNPFQGPAEDSVLFFKGQDAEDMKVSVIVTKVELESNRSKRKAEDDGDYVPIGRKRTNVGRAPFDKSVIVVKASDQSPKKSTIDSNFQTEDAGNISSTDVSEGEVDTGMCKNSEWFLQESRRCQKCNKEFKTPSDASSCLTNHNRLRCYLCFKVVRDTAKLFIHFAKRHKRVRLQNLVSRTKSVKISENCFYFRVQGSNHCYVGGVIKLCLTNPFLAMSSAFI
jgi:hypothetical protein